LIGNMKFEVPLVGVKVLPSLEGFEAAGEYRGVSYCDAVRRATAGEEVSMLRCIQGLERENQSYGGAHGRLGPVGKGEVRRATWFVRSKGCVLLRLDRR